MDHHDNTKTNIHIDVLRGIHTPDSLEDLLQKLAPADIVLLEAVGYITANQAWRDAYNKLTHTNSSSLPAAYKDQFKASYTGMVALGLVGTGKRIDLVDRQFSKEEIEQGKLSDSLQESNFMKLIFKTLLRPRKRYVYAEEYFRSKAERVRERDTLVTEQVVQAVTITHKEEIEAAVKKKGYCTIALVQGYLHRTTAKLNNALPGVTVTEHIFGEDLIRKTLQNDPGVSMPDKILADPSYQYTHKELDFFWAGLAQQCLDGMRGGTPTFEGGSIDANVEMMHRGVTHPVYVEHTNSLAKIGRIDDYNENELARTTVSLLKRLRRRTLLGFLRRK